MVSGLAYNKRQFVAFSGAWLTFPIVPLILSLVFLIATIVRISREGGEEMGVWKTSAMPTLIYSLPQDVQQVIKSHGSSQDRVKKVEIRLQLDQGWRVSGHVLMSPAPGPRSSHQPPPGWI